MAAHRCSFYKSHSSRVIEARICDVRGTDLDSLRRLFRGFHAEVHDMLSHKSVRSRGGEGSG
jgi:hypothetical protein